MDDGWTIIGRIVVAAVLGGLIGLDRELRGHAAGLRTNVLVAAAAAVFAEVSVDGFAELRGYDPSRVAADVVSGIGFLGAGAIFAAGGRPRGLTTAAALWASAAVGLSVGVGLWEIALALVAVTLLALLGLDVVVDRFLAQRRRIVRDLYVVVGAARDAHRVQSHLLEHDVRIRQLDMVPLHESVGIDLVVVGQQSDVEIALGALRSVGGIEFASDEKGLAQDS